MMRCCASFSVDLAVYFNQTACGSTASVQAYAASVARYPVGLTSPRAGRASRPTASTPTLFCHLTSPWGPLQP